MRRFALVGSIVALIAIALVFLGTTVPTCLGLYATLASCANAVAAAGRPWTPGPAAGTAVVIAVPLVALVAAAVPWRRLTRRALGIVALVAAVGGLAGVVAYDLTRETVITNVNYLGQLDLAVVGPNGEQRAIDAMFGAAIAAISVGTLLSRRKRPAATTPT